MEGAGRLWRPGGLLWVLVAWIQQGFGSHTGEMPVRSALMGMTVVMLGMGSFFVSGLLLQRRRSAPS